MYYYQCKINNEGELQSWKGCLNLISRQGRFCEAELTGRGSYFHVMTGPHKGGSFLCIPNWNVGCELSALNDVFWNREQVSPFMGAVDAETVVLGLATLKKLLDSTAA